MGSFIHHPDRKGWPVLVQEIDRRCILLYLPESVQGEIHGMAEDGEVNEFVAAEEQRASRRMLPRDAPEGIQCSLLHVRKTFPVWHGH